MTRSTTDAEKRFTMVTDSSSANYLLLTYLTDDSNTAEDDIGTVKEDGSWGLQAWSNGPDDTAGTADDYPLDAAGAEVAVDEWGMPLVDGGTRPTEFNYEYATEQNPWGAQQYLLDADSNYVILSDPINLGQIEVTNAAGDAKTLMLQYDGWMHGLPDMFMTLQENDWLITQDIADKVINIPAGTAATDGTNGFYIKPMETSVFLGLVPLSTPDLPDVTQADDINLTTDVPTFTEHNMGDMPVVTTVKYSEGVLVE